MVSQQADLLLINGVIDTLDPRTPRTDALAVCAGKVLATGKEALQSRGPSTSVLDLAGGYVMPGLLDVHNHHMLAGQMDLFELDVPPTLDLDSLLAAVAGYSATLGPDEWLVGGSWGAGLMQEISRSEERRVGKECPV